jgi:D-alanyl-D-alanine dipeptidase
MISETGYALSVEESLKRLESNPDFVDVSTIKNVQLDIRYASENNFLKKNLYGRHTRCFLHKFAAVMLTRAAENLERTSQNTKLLIFDCLRPAAVQKELWAGVVGTEQEKYVADPAQGSIHSYGLAVDLSLINTQGQELSMGTGFDDFSLLSEPALEEKYLKQGRLTAEHIKNRKLLRSVMVEAGFLPLAAEWWHFDALPKEQVRKSYKIIE